MAANRNASGAGRLTEAGINETEDQSIAAQIDRQARLAHMASLGFTAESMQAAQESVAAYWRDLYVAELSTFTLGLLFRRWLSQQDACNCFAAGVYAVPCPGCGNRDRWTVIIASVQPGRDGLFQCRYCPTRAREVIGFFPKAARDWALSEISRTRYEWYRLPNDERLARERATRELREHDRRSRSEYRQRKIGGAL